ncbi:efflux RND transporter permease subunit [bacterium]|nr:efflux RND transporter permease subunit [bacterium]
MTLPELAIRRPITTLMILVSLFVIGAIALTRLPLAFMPESEDPQVWVIVPYPNASPKTIERNILRPLEDHLGSIPGLKNMWSRADESDARVSLFFGWDEDMGMKKLEVRERIDRARAELPDDVERVIVSADWDPGRNGETILDARISADRDLSHGYDLLYDRIVRPLLRIPGVANVDLDGVNPPEIRIDMRLADLQRHNIEAGDVVAAIRENHVDKSIGLLRTGERNLMLRSEGQFADVQMIRDLIVAPESGIRLSDVAEVTFGEPPLEYGRHLDGKFALGIGVNKESSANTVEISRQIKEKVAEMADDPELEGVNFLIWEDQGKEILKTVDDLRNTGIIGAILASLVLYLFLRRVSSTFFAVLSIPFSLIVACGVIWATGRTLNTITLLGLIVGVGMLVDNAVVVMENINRYQEKGVEPRAAALLGSREVSVAVITATLTSIIVFLPIFFSERNEMNLVLQELGLTVCITLLASLFISQTLIPLASGRLLRASDRRTGPVMRGIQDRYVRALDFTLDHKWIGPVVGLAVIASAIYPSLKVDKNMEPSQAEMFVGIRYNVSEALSLEKREELATRVEKLLEPHREELQVRSVYSFFSNEWTMTRLYMADGHTNEAWMNEVRKKLPAILPEFPGVKLEVQDNVPFWQRNRGKRVGFQLTGEDTEVLSTLANEAKVLLEQVEGLHSFYSTTERGNFEVQTRVNRDLAREYGVGVNAAANAVELTFRGRTLPKYLDGDDEVAMRLTLDEQDTESLEQLRSLPVRQANGAGTTIPLATVADFHVAKGPDRIQRDNRVTGVWVGARFDEGTQDDYVEKCMAVLDTMALPYGYSWEHRQFRRDAHESQMEFVTNLLLALGLIFVVMAGLFESVRQAASLLVALPFALTGAAWTLYFTKTDFDQPAAVGLLLLFGIVVNNGIVMIEHINNYRRNGMPRREAMLTGGRERLRPVLMTAVTTLLGLLPIVIQKPSLAGVYYYSMALVIMGGLVISTVLTTILLPTTVCLSEDILASTARVARRAFGAVAGRIRRPRRAVAVK